MHVMFTYTRRTVSLLYHTATIGVARLRTYE